MIYYKKPEANVKSLVDKLGGIEKLRELLGALERLM